MDEEVPFSNLGSSFLLPSMIKGEIDQLKMLVRDLTIEMNASLLQFRTDIESRIGEIEESISSLKVTVDESSEQKTLLEARLEGIKSTLNLTSDKIDEFSVYSFFDPTNDIRIEIDEVVEDDVEDVEIIEVTRVNGLVAPDPEAIIEGSEKPVGPSPPDNSEVVPVEKNFCWWDGLDEETIASKLLDLLSEYLDTEGPVLNNQVGRRVYPADLDLTMDIKNEIKKLLKQTGCIVKSYRVDKFRVLYHKGEDGSKEYEKQYGKDSSEA